MMIMVVFFIYLFCSRADERRGRRQEEKSATAQIREKGQEKQTLKTKKPHRRENK